MERKSNISQSVIRRLPRYYRYLGALMDEGVERISSKELSDRMHVTASQIRQDLNNFGGFGQQGYGYNVAYLHDEIGKILGLDKIHNIIVVGAGHLCHALLHYTSYEKRGFRFIGIFDNNPNVIGTELAGMPIMGTDELPSFVKENNVEIGTIMVPKNQAQKVAELMVNNGIKAIWNFAQVDLRLPEDCVFENVHLSESLMKLSYNYFNNDAQKMR